MDIATLLGVALLVAGIWFTFDSLRAREIATAVSREYCRSRDLQFLDGTVALQSLGIGRSAGSVFVRRVYRFDFAYAGVSRHRGEVVMLGQTIERFMLDPSAGEL